MKINDLHSRELLNIFVLCLIYHHCIRDWNLSILCKMWVEIKLRILFTGLAQKHRMPPGDRPSVPNDPQKGAVSQSLLHPAVAVIHQNRGALKSGCPAVCWCHRKPVPRWVLLWKGKHKCLMTRLPVRPRRWRTSERRMIRMTTHGKTRRRSMCTVKMRFLMLSKFLVILPSNI